MNDEKFSNDFLDDEEGLEEILSQFAEQDEDFDEDLVVLAEKYGVDIEGIPMPSESDIITAEYYDSSYYDDEDSAKARPLLYDEYGRIVVYDEDVDGRVGKQDSEVKSKGQEEYFEGEKTYSQEDWRSSQKGRRKNMRRAERRRLENGSKSQERPALFIRFLRSFIPWRGDSSALAASKVLLTTFALILSVIGGFFLYSFMQTYRSPLVPLPTGAQTNSENEIIDPREKYPEIVFPEGLLHEFVDLYAQNSDFAGYLTMQGLDDKLNAPVVQSVDNKFYAANDFFKNKSSLGTPFLDYNNDLLQLNTNTVIYAGNAARAYRSTALSDYKNIEAFKNEPLITYWSRYGVYYWKIYAVIVTNGRPEQDNDYVFYFNALSFKDEEDFEGYREVLDQKKLYSTGVELEFGDKLLTISAYDSEFEGAYTVVVARLVRDGEALEVDSSLARVQENPRYPQAWYDRRKLENPYKNAVKWQP